MQAGSSERLKEIGRAAMPRLISAFLHTGDFGDREGMINACFLDGSLREIAGNATKIRELKPMAQPTKKLIRTVAKYWYIWWYADGHKIESFEVPDDEEEDD